MKRKYQELIAVFIILFIYLGIFMKPTLIIESGILSINIFKNKLFPSIFPFFVLASLLLELGIANKASKKVNPLFKFLFHVDGNSAFIILVSIISGFPSGSKYIALNYKKDQIDKNTANYLLTFTHFANPLFILGTCGIVLNSISLAYKILIIGIVSNIILGIILRPKKVISSKIKNDIYNSSILEALPTAINEAIKLLLFMLGSITFFMFLSKLITSFSSFDPLTEVIVTGILDMTSGISLITNLSSNSFIKGMLALTFITFGSFSVHLQVLNNIKEEDLEYKYFFLGRIINTAIALILYISF